MGCMRVCVIVFTKCHSNQVKWNYWQKLDFEFEVACDGVYYNEYYHYYYYYYCSVGRLHLNFDYDQLVCAIDKVIVLEIDLKILVIY